MFAWHSYARPVALKLWSAFVERAAFADWERRPGAPIDFIIEDKRARFMLHGALPRTCTIAEIDQLAEAASRAAGMAIDWIDLINVSGGRRFNLLMEIARQRANAKGFRETPE